MPSVLTVYSLGEHGVNRVKSPLQVKDGELLSAQNATVKPYQGQLALAKRDGMAKVNSSAAAGSLSAIVNLPFANPTGLGNSWILATSTPAIAANDIAWSPTLSIFAAVADFDASGAAMSSTDGLTWTQRTVGSTSSWKSVVWADTLGMFVAGGTAVSNGNYIAYSTNGTSWTIPSLPVSSNSKVLGWSPDLGMLVALPNNGATISMQYSTNGINWTNSNTMPVAAIWNAVAWSPSLGLFCAVRPSGNPTQACTSPDGTTWTLRTTSINSGWEDITWSETLGLFIAVASSGVNRVMTSPDGIVWTARSAASAVAWAGLTESHDGLLTAVARSGASQVMTSSDAQTWTSQTEASNDAWESVAYSPSLERLVAVASTGTTNAMYST